MPTEKKAEHIDKLENEFSKASIGILTDYRGLKTSEIDVLRRKLQDTGGDYKVVKNTLARIAAEKINRTDLNSYLEGPTAVAFGYDDVTQLAKAFADHVKAAKLTVEIKGGFLSDRLLTATDVNELATLPSKEVLLAKIVGGLKSPLYGLASVLNAPIQGLHNVLDARIKQMEDNN